MLKKYDNLLNLESTIAKELFESVDHPWEVLPKIKEVIFTYIEELDDNYIKYSENVYVHKDANISDKATIIGPCILGNSEVRPGAYIRGNAIIGDNCVIGNSTEIKNAIIFNNVQLPHYNYVGDAVLGDHAHTGAGVILSNVKNDKTNVIVNDNGKKIETNLRKFSAIIGDNVDVGCNSVVCPGSIIYPETKIYPLTMVRGVIGPNKIVKSMDNIIERR